MKPGTKVRCIDDQGWLTSPDYPHLTPEKGRIYTVREYERFGAVGAISLMEGNHDDFYRVCRFKEVPEVTRQECIDEARKLCAHLWDL